MRKFLPLLLCLSLSFFTAARATKLTVTTPQPAGGTKSLEHVNSAQEQQGSDDDQNADGTSNDDNDENASDADGDDATADQDTGNDDATNDNGADDDPDDAGDDGGGK
jgi:hypothetical protein